MDTKQTPRSLGYRMPAEWEKQEAVWVSWPHNKVTWPEKIEEVEKAYIQFIGALHNGQKIKVIVADSETEARASSMLDNAKVFLSQIEFHAIKNQDVWIRDYGPLFVVNQDEWQKLAMVKLVFNAWGNKYDDLKEDANIPGEINKIMNLPVFETGIVLEGGSIEVNGSGTLLTTEQCLLNKNRNPSLSKEDIENLLKDYLNVSNILWLKKGIAGDDTDGHIDDIARFVGQNTVVCAFEQDKSDDNYSALKENYDLLRKMKDENGSKLKVMKLPMPGIVSDAQSRLPASYANFYIGNDAVAVPLFGSKNDKKALRVLGRAFPGRKIVGIDCRKMVYGFGALHCVTLQEPKV